MRLKKKTVRPRPRLRISAAWRGLVATSSERAFLYLTARALNSKKKKERKVEVQNYFERSNLFAATNTQTHSHQFENKIFDLGNTYCFTRPSCSSQHKIWSGGLFSPKNETFVQPVKLSTLIFSGCQTSNIHVDNIPKIKLSKPESPHFSKGSIMAKFQFSIRVEKRKKYLIARRSRTNKNEIERKIRRCKDTFQKEVTFLAVSNVAYLLKRKKTNLECVTENSNAPFLFVSLNEILWQNLKATAHFLC